MRQLPCLITAVALAAIASPALAQKMAPGLWENQVEMGSADPQMQAQMKRAQEQMAKMPPEQRKMMEEMMAKQGVNMGAGGGKPSIRYCVTKEQAERNEIPADNEGRCKQESLQRSGNTMRFKYTCANPPSSGTGEVTFNGDKAYTTKMVVEGTSAKGQQGQMTLNSSAKWLSADCGAVKPRP